MSRAFYIEHLGCAKNRVDAEQMIGTLTRSGWRSVDDPASADLIIVNSCGFIEPAKRESVDTTLSLRSKYPGKRIILAGCLAERYGESLERQLREVDGIFGNRDPGRIVSFLDSGERYQAPPAAETAGPGAAPATPGSVYLKIAEGCDNHCTFCAIPIIRGRLRSRDPGAIADEFAALIDGGTFEVNLIAQDLASWGSDLAAEGTPRFEPFLDLIRRLLAHPGDFWLRLLYLHPDHFPEGLIELARSDPRLLPYFDLPVQHASAGVLRRMGRSGSSERYLELFDSIRSSIPDATIRSTFLVGFPGEGRSEAAELERFQEEATIDWLGTFIYSPEEGTAARRSARPIDRVSLGRGKRSERLRERIEVRQLGISGARLDRFVGRSLRVLIEERLEGSQLSIGRSFMHAPEVDGNVVVHGDTEAGRVVMCRVIKRNGLDLEAVVEE